MTIRSADDRRKIIDHIVESHTGLRIPALWGPIDDPAIVYPELAIAYRNWAIARAPILRGELEAMPDNILLSEKKRCNQQPEWRDFLQAQYEEIDRKQEVERLRQYHRSVAQKGGRAHRSTKQQDIIDACKDMYARDPKITAKPAYRKLGGTGHKMPDGRVVRFERQIAFETFRTGYWPQRTMLQ
jgi:hypothetical protein